MTTEAVEIGSGSWYLRQIGIVLRTLRKDRLPIILVTLALTVLGAVSGKLTNSASSSAQLLLTPIPLRTATTDDELSRMIAVPMDVKTASLLCMSDQVISRTAELLKEKKLIERPLKSLQALKSALSFEITVAKETPYETIYSPVLRLNAEGSSPSEAKALVNTWARACVELAEQYMERKQEPVKEAFQEQANKLRAALEEADRKLEAFRRDNNLQYYQERVTALTTLINETLSLRAETVQDMEKERAKRTALVAEQSDEEAKLKLHWTPSGRLANLLGGRLGLENTSEGETPGMLEVEQSNPVYEKVRQESALAQASAEGYKAALEQIDKQLESFEGELKTLQAEAARVYRLDRELLRETEVLESVYESAASKFEYAQMAAAMQKSEINLLSEGAEWRMPRFRRAILFGTVAGGWGFLLAAMVSLLVRRVLRPALEQSA